MDEEAEEGMEEGIQQFNKTHDKEISDDSSIIMSFQFVNEQEQHFAKHNGYDDTCILIDTGSTFSVIKNEKMLIDIHKSKRTLRSITNGGKLDHNMMGYLPGFFEVWYNPESRLNILSWADVRKKFRITSDTAVSNSIKVHIEGDKTMEFEEVGSGLYMWHPCQKSNLSKSDVSSYSFLTLVSSNKNNFTPDEVRRADKAKKLYQSIGPPGYGRYIKWLATNYIRNCPITVDDAKRALHIYGKDIVKLKATSVRKNL